ncbi:hypothetical protein BGZ67_010002, partial [Mortierella alpina]
MNNIAQKYAALGFVPIGVKLQWDEQTGKKKPFFMDSWKNATLEDYMEYIARGHNGLALRTGMPSDLYVVDCDLLKESDRSAGVQDGVLAFSDLVMENGLPDNTPVQESASGGKHYFFSLSKSLANGLLNPKNASKLRIEEPLVSSKDLPAVPQWLIKILNTHSDQPKNVRSQAESTYRLDIERYSGDVVLILDEVSSVLEQMTSIDTMGTLDADLTDREVSIIKSVRDDVHVIHNTFKPQDNNTVTLYEFEEELETK